MPFTYAQSYSEFCQSYARDNQATWLFELDQYQRAVEIERQRQQQLASSRLPQITNAQLIAAERRVALYFQTAPTNPTDQQLAQATSRYREKLATAAAANSEHRRLEQELKSASIVDKLLPGYQGQK